MLAIPESISNGGRIDLLPVAAGHTKKLYEAVVESKDELSLWMEWLHPAYSMADAEQWVTNCRKAWETDSMFGFTIFERRTRQILGGCSVGITSHLHRNGSIGYWIRSSRTKQGYASEAAALLAQFGFRQLGLIRIEILVAVGNTASERVAEKMGAVREGLLRNRLLFRGKPRDAYIFSVIPNELAISD